MANPYGFDTKIQPMTTFEGLPESLVLTKIGEPIVFDVFKEGFDFNYMYRIWEEIVFDGQTYPQDSTDEQSFRQYFLSNNCFVFRLESNNQTIGGFYIKANFPGRSSHLANFGMVVKKEYRSCGLGHIIVQKAIKMAKTLGYEALYTNLVYASNTGSITICKKHGFIEVGRVPRAGNLKGLGYTDALQLYKDVRNE